MVVVPVPGETGFGCYNSAPAQPLSVAGNGWRIAPGVVPDFGLQRGDNYVPATGRVGVSETPASCCLAATDDFVAVLRRATDGR